MQESLSPTFAPVLKRVVPYVAAIAIAGAGVGYAVHEHHAAQTLAAQNQQESAALNATRSQLDALAAKVNELAVRSETAPPPPVTAAPVPAAHGVVAPRAHPGRAHPVEDRRVSRLQKQVDAQGKEIEETRNDLASTQGNLVNARTELTGSIARTHDELVLLEKKGERNYYEFDLQKSKEFQHEGPVGMSLRKANTKHQYADLQLLVDDRNLSQKHVNLYQPVMFYPSDSRQPLEIVINDISKDHIHGYVSAPKYRQSELTAATGTSPAPGTASGTAPGPAPGPGQAANANPQPAPRQKLPLPQ